MSKLIDKKTNSSENSNKEEKSQSKNDLYNCTKDSNSIVIENDVYCSSPKLGNSVIISCFHKSKSQIFTPSVLSERTQPTIITNLVNNLSSIVKNNNEENEKNNEIIIPEKCINSKQNIEHKNKSDSSKNLGLVLQNMKLKKTRRKSTKRVDKLEKLEKYQILASRKKSSNKTKMKIINDIKKSDRPSMKNEITFKSSFFNKFGSKKTKKKVEFPENMVINKESAKKINMENESSPSSDEMEIPHRTRARNTSVKSNNNTRIKNSIFFKNKILDKKSVKNLNLIKKEASQIYEKKLKSRLSRKVQPKTVIQTKNEETNEDKVLTLKTTKKINKNKLDEDNTENTGDNSNNSKNRNSNNIIKRILLAKKKISSEIVVAKKKNSVSSFADHYLHNSLISINKHIKNNNNSNCSDHENRLKNLKKEIKLKKLLLMKMPDIATSNIKKTSNFIKKADLDNKLKQTEKEKIIKESNNKNNEEGLSYKTNYVQRKMSSILIKHQILKDLNDLNEDNVESYSNKEKIDNFYDYLELCLETIIDLDIKSQPRCKSEINFNFPKHMQDKKIALFDLDETLVHCVGEIKPGVVPELKCDHKIKVHLPMGRDAVIGINERPFWRESLDRIKDYYNIVIYTASHNSYSDAILNYLDKENKYFPYRLYRNNCVQCTASDGMKFYVKDLDIFKKNYDLKKIIIIDNSVLSFAFHLNNGIPVIPYYDSKEDKELNLVSLYLTSIVNCDDVCIENEKYFQLEKCLEIAKKNIEEVDNSSESDSGIVDDLPQNDENEKEQENNKLNPENEIRHINTHKISVESIYSRTSGRQSIAGKIIESARSSEKIPHLSKRSSCQFPIKRIFSQNKYITLRNSFNLENIRNPKKTSSSMQNKMSYMRVLKDVCQRYADKRNSIRFSMRWRSIRRNSLLRKSINRASINSK